jgi:hypothetical protein
MDTIMLSDADDLAAVLLDHPPLIRILTGHLHLTHLVPVAHSGPLLGML